MLNSSRKNHLDDWGDLRGQDGGAKFEIGYSYEVYTTIIYSTKPTGRLRR